MIGTAYSSIDKAPIPLSRNTPVALVVGAAGFLGSHLVEELLKKGIQVAGVDDLSTSTKDNLEEAIKNKKFHFINTSGENLDLALERLDYLILVAEGGWNIDGVLQLAKDHGSKIVLVSSIDLYEKKTRDWFKQAESKLARFTSENKLNARVLRLAAVYGPRMHFRISDPMVRLIQSSLLGQIREETAVLQFSSRALFIKDATELVIKSILSGGSSSQIFDGAIMHPVKVSDIKQVLLDPVWYETRNFQPETLPPWPTPNLSKTMKTLHWHPTTSLIEGLKETLAYFKEKEIAVPPIDKEEKEMDQDRKQAAEQWLKGDTAEKDDSTKEEKKKNFKVPIKIKLPNLWMLVGWAVVFYAVIWPAVSFSWGVLSFRQNLNQAQVYLEKGQFDQAKQKIQQAQVNISGAQQVLKSVELVQKIDLFKDQYEETLTLVDLSGDVLKGAWSSVTGLNSLIDGILAISGEGKTNPGESFDKARLELNLAYNLFAQVLVNLQDGNLESLPAFLRVRAEALKEKVATYQRLTEQAKAAAFILPKVVPPDGKKSYLVLLQNNGELRPTGGFIGSLSRIDFEGGRLKKIEVQDVYQVDGNLSAVVEPPGELKDDLGVARWFLRDSNWEPDFPTAARQSEWFYTKATGQRVDGVIAIDLEAIKSLLQVMGPLELADYNEKIEESNLFEKAITHAEQGFFPGSQAKKNFLVSLQTSLFNKLIFVPNQNWVGLVNAMSRAFEEKHFLVYLSEPKLFSYLVSQNLAGVLPRGVSMEDGKFHDFLAVVEANVGANKANFYLDRQIELQTGIGKEGEVTHRLKVRFVNNSPSEVWPAGKYKNRVRIYLPFGAQLLKATLGEKDLTKDVKAFADYGRSGFSLLLEINPKEMNSLVLDYKLGQTFKLSGGVGIYSLDIVKQAGTLKDPLNWTLNFPINFKVVSEDGKALSPQELNISTDLSRDRKFEVKLSST